MKCLDVIIPVRNDAQRLERCLDSIARLRPVEGLEVRVVVADNGSEDDSPGVARRASARVLDLPGLRVSALRNRAAAAADGEWLGFVDSDHELDPGWLEAADEAWTLHPAAAGMGTACDPPRDPTWVQSIYDGLRHHPDRVEETPWLGSGNLVMRRKVFDAAGGFDERLETCEDVDLCLRVRAAGEHLFTVPGMRSIHYGDPATLTALFRSELWRGRDNIRVTLRNGPTLRDLPSVGLPILSLIAVAGLIVALALVPRIGWTPVLWPVGALALVAAARLARMVTRIPPRSPVALLRLLAVAVVYEAARASSLVVRAAHRRA